MQAIRISRCRSCNSRSLKNNLFLGKLYLSKFLKGNSKPKAFSMSLCLCTRCFLLQLRETVPAPLLYTENYGYKSGVNNTMRRELKEITEKSLKKIKKNKEKIICVDVGANDGTLLKNYSKNIFKIGIEPIKKLAKDCKSFADIVINDFFSYESYKKQVGDKKASIITAISCFYDMEEPNRFLTDLTKILDKDGIFVIQQNYLKSMLELNAYDNVVHEHLEYYSMFSLKNLLKGHNLEIFDVETNNTNGGSFRTYIAFKDKRKISKRVFKLIEQEEKAGLKKEKTYREFAERVKNNNKMLRAFIKDQVRNNKKVYVYGASTRGNTLLQYCKLDNKLISAAVERNPEKWGKKIASVGIQIISEKQARKEKPDYMLVLPWFFKKEFLEREKAYLKSGGHFIFPLPAFEII